MRTVKIKNDSGANITILGSVLTDQEVLTINTQSQLEKFRASESCINDVTIQELIVQDADGDITDVPTALAWLFQDNPSQVTINQADSDTGGIAISPKFAPDGWIQRLHEVEFTTSTVGGALHDKDYTNTDTGWSSCDFYEDVGGVETLITGTNATTQSYLDANCIRTDFKWMPTTDYMILSGVMAQTEIPTNDIYVWGMMVDLDAIYGGPQVEVLGGGMNMRYVAERNPIGLRGVSGSAMYYSKVVSADGTETALPPGAGTNRIRYIVRHPVGTKHRLQSVFEIFRS